MKGVKPNFTKALVIVCMALLAQLSMAETRSFKDLDAFPRFGVVNDSVMGGISRSAIDQEAPFTRFEGNVSLANNGGFASARFLLSESFNDGERIQLRVKGDGQIYQLRFRTGGNWQAVSYSTRFQTIKDTWQTFDFLVEDFVPVWRSRMVSGAPPLTLSAVRQLEVFISDKQVGDFELMLDTITVPAS